MAASNRWCAALCLFVLLLKACNTAAQSSVTCNLLLKTSNSSSALNAQLSCSSDNANSAPTVTVAVNGSLISPAQVRQFTGVNVVDIEERTERWTAQAGRPVQAVLAFCGEDTGQLVLPRIQGWQVLSRQ
jgi:hypothetical protein